MSFADLKRKSANDFSFLQKELEKSSTERQSDDRFWKPELDSSGNGYAVIRFLPAPEGENVPWAKVYSHAFQGPGGWYIENSLTTKGEKDPVGEVNRKLWNSGHDDDKETARKQKRKLSYYSNIYVVKDPKNPENEGKVFLYKYGKKIFDKIQAAMNPEFQDEKPINVFDLWEGANFKLKIKIVGGYWNYDKSEFDDISALSHDDDELEKIWKMGNSLEAFTAPDQFKSYEELEKRLNIVLGITQRGGSSYNNSHEEDEDPIPVEEPVTTSKATSYVDDEDDDALAYFRNVESRLDNF